MIFTKDDIITTDKYLNAFLNNYYKTDVIIHKNSINWRNKIVYPPNNNMNGTKINPSPVPVDIQFKNHDEMVNANEEVYKRRFPCDFSPYSW